MRNHGAGLEWHQGTVTKDNPVQFHVHAGPHVLVPTGTLWVETEHKGTVCLKRNEALLVYPEERHRLFVTHNEKIDYTCVGFEGRM